MAWDGLVVDFVPYAHYMSECMAAPDLTDWQIFLSEYVIVAAVAWLHTVYNDFRMHILSPSLGKSLKEITEGASEALGGILNVEYLRSLARIHNRLEWISIHHAHTVVRKGRSLASGVDDDSYGAIIEFDLWGRFVFASESIRYDTRRFYCGIRPDGYQSRRVNPGEYPESKLYLTGFHSADDYPLVIQQSWLFHHVRLTWGCTHLNANPDRAPPMMLQIADESYVLIPGFCFPGVLTKKRGDPQPGRFN